MERLIKVFETMQYWYSQFVNIDEARATKEILQKKNDDSAVILKHFAATDAVKCKKLMKQETTVKANRAYLISRAEDEIGKAATLRSHLENKMIAEYAPLRITFWGKETPYYQWLSRKKVVSSENNNSGFDGFAIELPMSLQEGFNRMSKIFKGETWEDMLLEEYSNWTPAPEGHPQGQSYTSTRIPLIPQEKINNLDELVTLVVIKDNNETRVMPEINISGGELKIVENVLRARGSIMSCLYGIKEGSDWTTHIISHNGNTADTPYGMFKAIAHIIGVSTDNYKRIKDLSPTTFRKTYGIEN